MPAVFEAVDLKMAQAAVSSRKPDAGAQEARDFYAGEHWRNGDGWIGQKPPVSDPAYAAFLAAVAEGFVSENVTREVVERHVNGVLGREASWGLVPARPLAHDEQPNAQEQTLIDEAEAALTAWWDRRKPLLTLQEALTTVLLARRAVLRLLVPSGRRDAQGRLSAADLAAALDLLYLDAPDPASAAVVTDPDTRAEAGIFAYRREADDPAAPWRKGEGGDFAEITYLSDDGTTVLRVLGAQGVVAETVPPLALGGRLLMHELAREPLITPQVRQLQKALNLDLTQLMRNVNLAGSLERIFLNAQRPGQWVDSQGQPWVEGVSGGEKVFKPEPLPVGAGVSAFLMGPKLYNEAGELTGYANPSVSYRDPVAVGTFTDTRQTARLAILDQVGQLHAEIAGDATASGESRKQARAEFATTLARTKTRLDDAGRWLIETALAWAAAISGQPDRYAALRCEFAAQVDPGPLTADERNEIIKEYEAGLLSRETAIARLGGDDPDAEIARINAEQQASDQQFATLAGQAIRTTSSQGSGQQSGQGNIPPRLTDGQAGGRG